MCNWELVWAALIRQNNVVGGRIEADCGERSWGHVGDWKRQVMFPHSHHKWHVTYDVAILGGMRNKKPLADKIATNNSIYGGGVHN